MDGGKVTVELDPEVLDDLEVMALEDVERARAGASGASGYGDGQLLVTYEGIVYDVTEFAESHPGGSELLLTATGLDLKHFFENYTVHGASDKQGRKRVTQRLFNVGVLEAMSEKKASTL